MSVDAEDVLDVAIAWHVRQREMGEADWARFTEWLEADAAHAAAFDRVIQIDEELASDAVTVRLPLRETPQAPLIRRPRWRPGAVAGAAAVAASAALLLLPSHKQIGQPYEVATRAGERRVVALADGGQIEMNGGTRLRLDRGGPRAVTLIAGEAVFDVRHDSARPFTVHSGPFTVTDLGTVFDVLREGSRIDVAVAQGSVAFARGEPSLMLSAGAAVASSIDGRNVVRSVQLDTIGEWRSGRLTFAREPLPRVVTAVERLTGTRIELAGALPSHSLTGIVSMTNDPAKDVPRLAALMGAKWRHDGRVWRLSAR